MTITDETRLEWFGGKDYAAAQQKQETKKARKGGIMDIKR